MLGYPTRRVELEQAQIDSVLLKAVSKYAQGMPCIKRSWIQGAVGRQSYNFTTLSKPYGKGVIAVYPEPIHSPQSPFNEFDYWRMRQPAHIEAGDLLNDKLYFKQLQQLTGTEFDWEWDQGSATLLITPSPTRALRLAYEYEDDPTEITDIPVTGHDWVADYALALCKQIVGRVRNKFQGVPGNELSIQTDGAELISEGQQEQEKLEQKLEERRGDWTPPIRG